MFRRSAALLIAITLSIVPLETAQAAKQIAFSWSTTFELTYEPSSAFKPGSKPKSSTLQSWATQTCAERYDLLYSETLGASGRVMGKSNPKATKKNAKVKSSGWRLDEFGENEFYINYSCSGSMQVPVTGPSKTYSIKVYVQDWNYLKGKKYKEGISRLVSRDYSIEELDANNWKVTMIPTSTDLIRCCSMAVWGPVPNFEPIEKLNLKLLEARDFSEDERTDYGYSGQVNSFELTDFGSLASRIKNLEIKVEPYSTGSGYVEETFIKSNEDSSRFSIYSPKSPSEYSARYFDVYVTQRLFKFVEWVQLLTFRYEFDRNRQNLVLVSKSESYFSGR